MSATQLVLERTFLLLQRFLRWPRWDELERELYQADRITEPWEAVRSVPAPQVWGLGTGEIEPEDSRTIGLSVAGLARVRAAREDVDLFVSTLRLAAEMGAEDESQEIRLTPRLLTERVPLPAAGRDDLLKRQRALWEADGRFWSSISGTPGDLDWSVVIKNRTVRRFIDTDLDSFLSQSVAGRLPAEGPSRRIERLFGGSGAVYAWFPDEVLGSGGYGRVVYAGEGPGGTRVAVKNVPLRGFDTTKWMEDGRYAEREVAVHAHLRDRKVAYVLDLLDETLTEDALYLVSPRADFSLGAAVRLVGGAVRNDQPGDLAAASLYGANGPTENQILATAIELARGLVELHDAEVIHRDIKPDNSVLHEGRWKWCDLGTSRVLTDITSTYTLREHGTLPYQAPEVTRGDPQSRASDVYAFGCTLYALAVGHPPFTGPADEIIRHHRDTEPDLTGIANQRLANLLRWMLKKVPAGRITTQGVLDWLLDEPDPESTNPRLGELAAAAERRQAVRAAVEARVNAREQAAEAADALLEQIWAKFVTRVQREIPTVRSQSATGSHILTWEDRRIIVLFTEPADGKCSAVRLGTVIVEAEGSHPRIEVANLCAFPRDGQRPDWRLLRMQRNDGAPHPNRVSESLSDGLGAISTQDLEDHLRDREAGVKFKAATTAQDNPLTPEALEQLFVDEVTAIDTDLEARATQGRNSSADTATTPPATPEELELLRASVLSVATDAGVPVPIRATGTNPTVVTFSDEQISNYFTNRDAYKRAMQGRTVNPQRSFPGAAPKPLTCWGRAELETWIAEHAG